METQRHRDALKPTKSLGKSTMSITAGMWEKFHCAMTCNNDNQAVFHLNQLRLQNDSTTNIYD